MRRARRTFSKKGSGLCEKHYLEASPISGNRHIETKMDYSNSSKNTYEPGCNKAISAKTSTTPIWGQGKSFSYFMDSKKKIQVVMKVRASRLFQRSNERADK